MKKMIAIFIAIFLNVSFGAPVTGPNGGTGISNNIADTITTHAPMVFPDNMNFQYIYNHDVNYPEVGFILANNAFAAFEVLDSSLNCMLCVTPLGIYSDFPGGFSYRSTSDDTWFRLNHTEDDSSMALQLHSIEKGVAIFPAMTSAQKNSINMTSAQLGTAVYDTTQHALNIWDGSNKHPVLTDNHVLAGANSTITNNNDGTIIISSSGGGSGPTSAWGSFVINNSGLTMSVQTSYTPIPGASGFSDQSSSEFSNQLMSISGINTPIAVYTGTPTQSFTINATVSAAISSVITNTYYLNISIRKANGTIINTPFENFIILKNLNDAQVIAVNGSEQLSTGDGIFFQMKASSAANVNAKNLTADITNKTGSIANSDGLPQGSNNLYLSQNGGGNYQYLSGAATLANIPRFSSTGGQLSDSGVPSSSLLVSTASYVNPTWFVSLDGSKLTGTVTPNSASGGDLAGTYPNPTVASNAITYAKFQQIAASSLFGNPTAGMATGQAIPLGSTLFFSGTALQTVAFTGDVTSSANSFATTLATVNSNTGNFGDSTHTNTLTVNGKGLITAISSNLITPAGIGAPTTTGTGASGTWGINVSGNSATVTTNANLTGPVTSAGNATTVTAASITNAMLAGSIDLTSKVTGVLPFGNGGLGYSSAILGDIFLATATNTPGKLADVATGRVLISGGVGAAPSYSASPTLNNITLNNGGSTLSGITPGASFTSALGAGNYLNWGSGGRNQGIIGGGNFFLSNNLDYNGSQYQYWSTAAGASIEIGQGVISLRYTPSGTAGATATMSNALSTTTVGDVLIPNGNLQLQTAGKTLSEKSGVNGCLGTQVLSGATTTINTACATTGDLIFFTITSPGGTPGQYSFTLSNGVSITVTSTLGALDTSTIGWWDLHKT